MVAPGTGPNPPKIRRVGSPAVCESIVIIRSGKASRTVSTMLANFIMLIAVGQKGVADLSLSFMQDSGDTILYVGLSLRHFFLSEAIHNAGAQHGPGFFLLF